MESPETKFTLKITPGMTLPARDFSENGYLKSAYDMVQKITGGKEEIVIHTSGSTGKPKPFIVRADFAKASAEKTLSALNISEGSRFLLCLPAEYIAGIMMIFRALTGKAELTVIPPDPVSLSGVNEDYDLIAVTPYQISKAPCIIGRGKNILIGGSRLTGKAREFSEQSGTNVFETYGMTETYSHIALRRIAPTREHMFYCLDGVTVSALEKGTLTVNAPHLGILGLNTNDKATVHSDKTFEFVGRLDKVINSGGIKVHPEELETSLEELIRGEYAVSSVPHEILGEAVVCILIAGSPHLEEDLASLKDFKSKRGRFPTCVALAEKFIRSASGKLLLQETLDHPSTEIRTL